MILARAIAASTAQVMPVPLLDDWLAATIHRGTIRRIAEGRQVDLDAAALRRIADGREPPPSWRTLASSLTGTRLLGRVLRKAFLVLTVARRADQVARHFASATLFDHYCARIHVGLGIGPERARVVRSAIDQALAEVQSGIGRRLMRRGLGASGRALLQVPRWLADGWLKRAAEAAVDGEAAEEILESSVAEARRPGGFLARASQAVEAAILLSGSTWIEDLVVAFERVLEVPRDRT